MRSAFCAGIRLRQPALLDVLVVHHATGIGIVDTSLDGVDLPSVQSSGDSNLISDGSGGSIFGGSILIIHLHSVYCPRNCDVPVIMIPKSPSAYPSSQILDLMHPFPFRHAFPVPVKPIVRVTQPLCILIRARSQKKNHCGRTIRISRRAH